MHISYNNNNTILSLQNLDELKNNTYLVICVLIK